MNNKLVSGIFTKTSWGSDVVWSITEHYMARTVEINPGHRTPLGVYKNKYKTILVTNGELFYHFLDESDYKVVRILEGWYQFIPLGIPHLFEAKDKLVRFIEISNPVIEDAFIMTDSEGRIPGEPELAEESYKQLMKLFNTDARKEGHESLIKRSVLSDKKRRQIW